jgi:hypothetical protein
MGMGTTEVCSPMPATVNLLEPNGMPIVLRLVCADAVRCRHQASPLELGVFHLEVKSSLLHSVTQPGVQVLR